MIGVHAGGNAPVCSDCKPRTRRDCDYAGAYDACGDLVAYNDLMGAAWNVAEAVAAVHDDERRRTIAESCADGFANALDPLEFDTEDFLRLCRVRDGKKVAA
jgi:hypothetical protein